MQQVKLPIDVDATAILTIHILYIKAFFFLNIKFHVWINSNKDAATSTRHFVLVIQTQVCNAASKVDFHQYVPGCNVAVCYFRLALKIHNK